VTDRLLKLRYPATCVKCGADLSAGTRGWWDLVVTRSMPALYRTSGKFPGRRLQATQASSPWAKVAATL